MHWTGSNQNSLVNISKNYQVEKSIFVRFKQIGNAVCLLTTLIIGIQSAQAGDLSNSSQNSNNPSIEKNNAKQLPQEIERSKESIIMSQDEITKILEKAFSSSKRGQKYLNDTINTFKLLPENFKELAQEYYNTWKKWTFDEKELSWGLAAYISFLNNIYSSIVIVKTAWADTSNLQWSIMAYIDWVNSWFPWASDYIKWLVITNEEWLPENIIEVGKRLDWDVTITFANREKINTETLTQKTETLAQLRELNKVLQETVDAGNDMNKVIWDIKKQLPKNN